jgi:hypothetical protein
MVENPLVERTFPPPPPRGLRPFNAPGPPNCRNSGGWLLSARLPPSLVNLFAVLNTGDQRSGSSLAVIVAFLPACSFLRQVWLLSFSH